jgi:DNA-binding response OmpR family regulator
VLVVEDDPLLRGMVEDALDEGGFKVTTVGSAKEAIALMRGKATSYCALVTISICRGAWMGGKSLARPEKSIRDFPSFT